MAKEQKRGNREIRKPKAKKSPAPVAGAALPARGLLAKPDTPKKKN